MCQRHNLSSINTLWSWGRLCSLGLHSCQPSRQAMLMKLSTSTQTLDIQLTCHWPRLNIAKLARSYTGRCAPEWEVLRSVHVALGSQGNLSAGSNSYRSRACGGGIIYLVLRMDFLFEL